MATSSSTDALSSTTILLLGKTGNGKSATGNSILGRKAFKSQFSMKAVTTVCKCGSVTLPNGRVVRVIDTPGSPERIPADLITWSELAKDGVHAVLLVMSITNRFTEEKLQVVQDLRKLFGEAVMRHTILLFTGGDEFFQITDWEKTTAQEFLEEYRITALDNLLDSCGRRMILFDNMTQDKEAKDKQVMELLQLVDETVRRNVGTPYSHELFEPAKAIEKQKAREVEEEQFPHKAKKLLQELRAQLEIAYADHARYRAETREVEKQLRDEAKVLELRIQAQLESAFAFEHREQVRQEELEKAKQEFQEEAKKHEHQIQLLERAHAETEQKAREVEKQLREEAKKQQQVQVQLERAHAEQYSALKEQQERQLQEFTRREQERQQELKAAKQKLQCERADAEALKEQERQLKEFAQREQEWQQELKAAKQEAFLARLDATNAQLTAEHAHLAGKPTNQRQRIAGWWPKFPSTVRTVI